MNYATCFMAGVSVGLSVSGWVLWHANRMLEETLRMQVCYLKERFGDNPPERIREIIAEYSDKEM